MTQKTFSESVQNTTLGYTSSISTETATKAKHCSRLPYAYYTHTPHVFLQISSEALQRPNTLPGTLPTNSQFLTID